MTILLGRLRIKFSIYAVLERQGCKDSSPKVPHVELTFVTQKIEKHRKELRCLHFSGGPGRIRTCDLLIRSQTLYPTELRSH